MTTTTFDPANLSGVTLTGSNLIATCSVGNGSVRGADGLASGLYYFEQTYTTKVGNVNVGLCNGDVLLPSEGSTGINAVYVLSSGTIGISGATSGSTLGALATGAIIGIAVNLNTALIWFRIAPSGNWNGSASANPATGVGGVSFASIFPAFQTMYPIAGFGTVNDKVTANFGASAFSGTVPSGFTSGWTAGSGVAAPKLVATQVGAETWIGGGTPALTVTQLGAEVFFSMIPALVVTQLGAEVYFDQGSLITASAKPMVLVMA